MSTERKLKQKFALIWPHLDERARRMMAANEARELGHGGVSRVSRACGLSRVAITKGMRELRDRPLPAGRIRRPGAIIFCGERRHISSLSSRRRGRRTAS